MGRMVGISVSDRLDVCWEFSLVYGENIKSLSNYKINC